MSDPGEGSERRGQNVYLPTPEQIAAACEELRQRHIESIAEKGGKFRGGNPRACRRIETGRRLKPPVETD